MICLVPAIHVVVGFTKCECNSEDSYFSGKIGNSHGLRFGSSLDDLLPKISNVLQLFCLFSRYLFVHLQIHICLKRFS